MCIQISTFYEHKNPKRKTVSRGHTESRCEMFDLCIPCSVHYTSIQTVLEATGETVLMYIYLSVRSIIKCMLFDHGQLPDKAVVCALLARMSDRFWVL
jgi:hypothetical protein